jgi:hypothetical protein
VFHCFCSFPDETAERLEGAAHAAFHPSSFSAINEFRIQSGVASGNALEAELLPDQLLSAGAHCARSRPVTQQIENSSGERLWRTRADNEARQAIANDVTAAGQICRYDGQAGEGSLEEHSGHPFAVFGRKREYVCEAK